MDGNGESTDTNSAHSSHASTHATEGTRRVVEMKSSYCDSSSCVGVTFDGTHVSLGHYGESGPKLRFTSAEWSAFLDDLHTNSYDV